MLFSKQLLPTGAAQVFNYTGWALWACCCLCLTQGRDVFVPTISTSTGNTLHGKAQHQGPDRMMVAITCSTTLSPPLPWHRGTSSLLGPMVKTQEGPRTLLQAQHLWSTLTKRHMKSEHVSLQMLAQHALALRGEGINSCFSFQDVTPAGTKENRGGSTSEKPFSKHLHSHARWQNKFTRCMMQGADKGFLPSGQTFSSEGTAGVSSNYLHAFAQLQWVENTNRRTYKSCSL